MTATFAISVSLDRWFHSAPSASAIVPAHGFLLACTVFWLAMGGLSLSDHLDNREIDQRRGLSALLNAISIIILPIAFIAWMGMFMLALTLWFIHIWGVGS